MYASFQATVLRRLSLFLSFFHFIQSRCNIVVVRNVRGGLIYVYCTSQALVNSGQKSIPNNSKIQPIISYYLASKKHKAMLFFLRKD